MAVLSRGSLRFALHPARLTVLGQALRFGNAPSALAQGSYMTVGTTFAVQMLLET